MRKVLQITGIILGLIVLILMGIGFLNAGDYKVSRSKEMAVSPEQIYKLAGNYRKWNDWSPWAKLDPNQTITVSGQPYTVGHHFTWKGNEQVGEGNMTITALKENEYIKEDLVFTAPQESACKTLLLMKRNGDKTQVTWEMSGKSGVVDAIFMTLMGGAEKMIGADFERGLDNLEKAAASETITPVL